MSDYDTLAVELEDIKDEIQFLRRSCMGLSLPKQAHARIREIGYQHRYSLQVPIGNGAECFILDTMTQVNGDFQIDILDMCGTRLWHGVFKDAP